MPQFDLDQGGRIPQVARTYLGPSVGWVPTDLPADVEFVISANIPIGAGFKGVLQIPFWLTIHGWNIYAGQSGSIIYDIYKTTKALYLGGHVPNPSDSICASDRPTLSGGVAASGTALIGWNTQINQNDVLGFNVVTVSSLQQVTLCLECVRINSPNLEG